METKNNGGNNMENKKEREYRIGILEGGEGYNPYTVTEKAAPKDYQANMLTEIRASIAADDFTEDGLVGAKITIETILEARPDLR